MDDFKYFNWAKDTVRKLQYYLQVFYATECRNLEHATKLVFDWNGEDSYCSKVDWVTHIGVAGVAERYRPFINEKPEALIERVRFTIRHEICHLKYTSGKEYKLAVEFGARAVYEHVASQMAGHPVRFKSEMDCETWKRKIRIRSAGFYIPQNAIENIAAGIANSLCDGRIERIESYKDEGFKKERILCRGENWDFGKCEFPPLEELEQNASLKLSVVLNQILCLSKYQAYQKGFTMAYAGTPLMDVVNDLMPEISEGYLADTTMEMKDASIKICRKLAPLIFEAVQMSAEDAEAMQAFQKMLQQLIESLVDEADYGNVSNNAESGNTEGAGAMNSALPFSNLVITLPDEKYDKLMANAKEGEGGGGIQIRREHPLPEEEKPENKSGNSSGSGSDSSSSSSDDNSSSADGNNSIDDESADSSSAESGEDQSKEKGAGKGSGSSEDKDSASQQSGNAENGEKQHGNPSSSGNSSGDAENGSESSDSEEPMGSSGEITVKQAEKGQTEHTQATKKEAMKFSGTPDETVLQKAMEEAANGIEADISKMIDSVNQIATMRSNTVAKKPECTKTQPLDPNDIKDICEDFREVRRAYRLDKALPDDLKVRADVLRRETERYIKKLREPNQKARRSGLLDSKQLARLARNDTRVFMKKGKAKKADYCYYILLDNSGSTGGKHGNKRLAECRAAAIQEEAYKGIFPMKIVAFDCDWNGVVHEVIKDWDENLHQNCCINFGAHGRDGGGNEDNYDIAIATRELLARPERNKMLVVLSDGAPGDTRATKEAIADARKKGIKVVGIYFEEGGIEDAEDFIYMYEKDYILSDMLEVEKNLTKVIAKFSKM